MTTIELMLEALKSCTDFYAEDGAMEQAFNQPMVTAAIAAGEAVCGGRYLKKFSDSEVYRIRDMHKNGCGYKQVNKYYSMSEKTFYNIVKHRGAYK